MTRVASLAPSLLVLPMIALACVACSRPAKPEKDRPPEPQAASTVAAQPSALRRYMQSPIQKAQSVEGTVLDAAKQQRADIDAQMAGDAPAQAPAAEETPAY